ncbi:MAG: c-type cytochrome [Limnohabitans sp.]
MKPTLFLFVCAMAVSGASHADQSLANSKNCFACHAIDKSVMGPAYKDVAAKYAGDKEALDFLAKKIQKGGDGVWGSIPMPPNAQVNDAQAKKLAAWVLNTK